MICSDYSITVYSENNHNDLSKLLYALCLHATVLDDASEIRC